MLLWCLCHYYWAVMLLLSDFSHVDSKCLAPIPRTLGSERLAVVDPVKTPAARHHFHFTWKCGKTWKLSLSFRGRGGSSPIDGASLRRWISLPHFPSGPERPSGPCRGNPRTTGQDAMGAVIPRGQTTRTDNGSTVFKLKLTDHKRPSKRLPNKGICQQNDCSQHVWSKKRSLASWKLNTDYL